MNAFMKSGMIYALAMIFGRLVSFFVLPVTTRLLPPEAFGRLELLQTLVDLLTLIFGLQIAQLLHRFAGQAANHDQARQIAAGLFAFLLALTPVVLLVLMVAAQPMQQLLPGNLALQDVRLMMVTVAITPLLTLCLAWAQYTDRAVIYSMGFCGKLAAQVALMLALLHAGWDETAAALSSAIATLVAALILGIWLFRQTGLLMPALPLLRRYTRFVAPLVLVALAGFLLRSSDRFLVAEFFGPAMLAQYAIAAKFSLLTGFMLQPYLLWWNARKYRIFSKDAGQVAAMRGNLVALTAPFIASICIAATAPLVVHIIIPPALHPAPGIIAWSCMLAGLHIATGSAAFGLMQQGRTEIMARIDLVTALGLVGLAALMAWHRDMESMLVAMAAFMALRLAVTLRFSIILCPQGLPVRFWGIFIPLSCLSILLPSWLGSDILVMAATGIAIAVIAAAFPVFLIWRSLHKATLGRFHFPVKKTSLPTRG